MRNFYQKGLNNIGRGIEETPRLFVIPAAQRDPVMAAYLVNQLRRQHIEIHRVDTGTHKNDYVVLLDQPYRNLAVTLLSRQNFSKDAKFLPYDDIAWTLGYLYGVEVRAEDSVKYSLKNLSIVSEDVKYKGMIKGNGEHYVLNYKAQHNLLPSLYWLKSENSKAAITVLDAKTAVEGLKDTLAAGSVLFKGLTAVQAAKMATQFGLDLQAIKSGVETRQHTVTLPRVAIYHTWYYTQDDGWSRLHLNRHIFPIHLLTKMT